MESQGPVRISQAARLTGLHTTTIRRLEERGLVRPRRDFAGHRRFSQKDIERLRQLVGLEQTPRAQAE